MTPDDFEGNWSLVSWEADHLDHTTSSPFGADPVGVISYGGGRMSCHMAVRGRASLARDAEGVPTEAERARAFVTYVAYAGPFEVVGSDVIHHVDVSLFPGWVGIDLVRAARFEGDLLHLTALMNAGTAHEATHRRVWRAIAPGARLS